MRTMKPAIALDPRHFGRGAPRTERAVDSSGCGLSDDLRLFATTFAAGFLFVSMLLV